MKYKDAMLSFVQSPEVKTDLQLLMRPLIDIILEELNPYILLTIIFIGITFLLILSIFLLLLRALWTLQSKIVHPTF